MEHCKDCMWHYPCKCESCKDKEKVVCSLKNEHVPVKDNCSRFVKDS